MVAAATVATASADDTPLSTVQYTHAREHDIRKRIELPGTVEAPRSSLVASDVEGVVVAIHAREGAHVRKGASLVSLRTDQLDLQVKSARAQLREAEARRELAERNLERSEGLFEGQVLSSQQLDDARFELMAWRGRVDQLSADIERIELDLERSEVRAPFSGVVVSELTEVGQWLGKGATVMELMSPYQLEVRVEVPERYFSSVRRGSDAVIRFEAIPGFELEGKVASVVPKTTGQARTFPLRIRIENKEQKIGAGMVANVSLSAGNARPSTLVPKDAVITRGTKKFIYVIGANDVIEMVPVELGDGVSGWVEVKSVLPAEARVVTRGNERVQPGQRVVAEPMEYAAP